MREAGRADIASDVGATPGNQVDLESTVCSRDGESGPTLSPVTGALSFPQT